MMASIEAAKHISAPRKRERQRERKLRLAKEAPSASRMGKPLFRLLHKMIPVWMSFLKVLKKAPKSLPSVKSQIVCPSSLMTTLQCGHLQTDSFSYDRSALGQHCSRPRTDSLRIDGPAEWSATSSYTGVSYSTDSLGTFSSATDTTASTSFFSEVYNNQVFANSSSEQVYDQVISFSKLSLLEGAYEMREGMKPFHASAASNSFRGSEASDCYEGDMLLTVGGEERSRDGRHQRNLANPRTVMSEAAQEKAGMHLDSLVDSVGNLAGLVGTLSDSVGNLADRVGNLAGSVGNLAGRVDSMAGTASKLAESEEGEAGSMGELADKMEGLTDLGMQAWKVAGRRDGNTDGLSVYTKEMVEEERSGSKAMEEAGQSCGWKVAEQSCCAVVKYSEDPYCDFLSSMEEMMMAKEVWNREEDLEELLYCYLSLNPPTHHRLIRLAFVHALAQLCIPGLPPSIQPH